MSKPYFAKLMAFVTAARAKSTVFPPEGQTYTALCLTPLESIKVVILGQVSIALQLFASFQVCGSKLVASKEELSASLCGLCAHSLPVHRPAVLPVTPRLR